MFFPSKMLVKCFLVAFGDVGKGNYARYEANGGDEGESLPSERFVEVFRSTEDVVGHCDDCEVACDVVEETDGVDAGREEGRVA